MADEHQSLGEALPKEMARVRDKILPLYDACSGGDIAAAMMRNDLDRAAKALAEGDIAEMIRTYNALMEYQA